MARMTLTFGQVPNFEEFSAAYRNGMRAETLAGVGYEINARGEDAAFLDEMGYSTHMFLNAADLYALLEALVTVSEGHHAHGEPWSEEIQNWAGSFASSILSTLGIEWV